MGWVSISNLNGNPLRRRLCLYGAIGAGCLGYLAWSIWGAKPPAPGVPVTASTAAVVAKMPQRIVQPRRLAVIADRAKAADRLGVAPLTHEEIQAAVTVPKVRYGGTATVLANMSTGQTRVVITPAPTPWLGLLRDNALGAGYGIGVYGQTAAVRYRRDVLQIKALHLSGELEANWAEQRPRPVEGRVMGWLEYRW